MKVDITIFFLFFHGIVDCLSSITAAIRTARRGGFEVSMGDFEDALKSFFAGRGLSIGSITEMVTGMVVPAWLKQLTGGSSDSQPGFAT